MLYQIDAAGVEEALSKYVVSNASALAPPPRRASMGSTVSLAVSRAREASREASVRAREASRGASARAHEASLSMRGKLRKASSRAQSAPSVIDSAKFHTAFTHATPPDT